MKIGFYCQWDTSGSGNIIGDEQLFNGLRKTLIHIPGVEAVDFFCPSRPVTEIYDVMIHMNDSRPDPAIARKHVLYLQTGWDNCLEYLEHAYTLGYDGYIFISEKLLSHHVQTGHSGIYLPFGVDLEEYYPVPADPAYSFDVAYVGGDIKGTERTMRFLYPAIHFDFGLFGGSWSPPRNGKSKYNDTPYNRIFRHIERGIIPQDKLTTLYSNAKISLNFTLQGVVDTDTITLRALEVLACGGFLISDRTPSLERALSGGAIFTNGGHDLFEKIGYYLAHDEERHQIAAKGHAIVTETMSAADRARELHAYLSTIVGR